MTPLLQVRGLKKTFGGIQALDGVDLQIASGEIKALIGPNGAGKTTLFNCLTGMTRPSEGQIFLDGATPLKGLLPHQITKLGLARTFQNIRLFDSLTVIENVMVGAHCRFKANFLDAFFHTRRHLAEEKEIKEKAYYFLEVMGLLQQALNSAKNLAYADQRRLEIARALASEPRLLLLDEPAAGMNAAETAELDQLIVRLKEEFSLSFLLIEHDMKLVMKISDSVIVMDRGRSIAGGSPEEIRKNPAVITAYLGAEGGHA